MHMGKAMYELREMLNEELNKITKTGELNPSKLDIVDKLTHSIKSIDTICAMEEEYEDEYSEGSYAGARGRGRNARRDRMGRYSREGSSYEGGSSYDGGSSYGGGSSYEGGSSYARGGRGGGRRSYYSRDEGNKQEAIQRLQELLNEASDGKVRMAIQNALEEMQKG